LSTSELSEYQLRSLGEVTAKHVKRFYKNPENKRRFEEWFLKTYGYSYTDYKEREKYEFSKTKAMVKA
jgi:hypothetical protein